MKADSIMIPFVLALAVNAADVPTYDEQVQRCQTAAAQSGFPIGSRGEASMRQECGELEETALRRETGTLIAQGRCGEATALALRAGDLQLAGNIRAFCGTPRR